MFLIDEKILRETVIYYGGYKIRACVLRFSLWGDSSFTAKQQVVFIAKQYEDIPFEEICLN